MTGFREATGDGEALVDRTAVADGEAIGGPSDGTADGRETAASGTGATTTTETVHTAPTAAIAATRTPRPRETFMRP